MTRKQLALFLFLAMFILITGLNLEASTRVDAINVAPAGGGDISGIGTWSWELNLNDAVDLDLSEFEKPLLTGLGFNRGYVERFGTRGEHEKWHFSARDSVNDDEMLINSIVPLADDIFVAAGRDDSFELILASFPRNGRINWSKEYFPGEIGAFKEIIKLPNGTLLVVGELWKAPFGSVVLDRFIMNITDDGEIIYVKRLPDSFGGFQEMVLLANGQVLVAGTGTGSTTPDDIFGIYSPVSQQLELFRFGSDYRISTLAPRFDGGFLIAGAYSGGGYDKCWVASYDANSALAWSNVYDVETYNQPGTVSGISQIAADKIGFSCYEEGGVAGFTVIDDAGTVQWHRSYYANDELFGHGTIKQITPAHDGGIYLAAVAH